MEARAMFNCVTLVGRLARNAELGHLPDQHRTPRLRFTLAVDREYEVDGEIPTDFWPAEVLGDYGVGRLVLVRGSAHLNTRKDGDGGYRVLPYVAVRSIRFLEKRQGWAEQPSGADATG
jgi:single-stranded DNA-binding protein